MKYFLYTAAALALYALNFGLFSYLKIGGAVPNLLLLFLIVLAVEKQNFDFVFISFLGGMLLDFSGGNLVGGFTLSFLLIGFLLQVLVNLFVVEELKWQILLLIVFLSVAGLDGLLWAYHFFGHQAGLVAFSLDWKVLRGKLLGDLLYNAALFYPVYFFGNFLRNWISTIQYNASHR